MGYESTQWRPSELPGGELAFRFGSGRLCLALTATVGVRWRRNFDRLQQPDDLSRWVCAAGLLTAPPRADQQVLRQARRLREAIYRAIQAGRHGRVPDDPDRELLNAWSRRHGLAPQLGADGGREAWPGPEPVRACLSSVARDAVELLTGPQITRVRECAAADCALLFLDRSRPGRRRWCADGACGAKARAASYRHRHAPGPAGHDERRAL